VVEVAGDASPRLGVIMTAAGVHFVHVLVGCDAGGEVDVASSSGTGSPAGSPSGLPLRPLYSNVFSVSEVKA